jgi:hypothetical protein
MSDKKVERFAKVVERAFSADMEKLANHDMKKYQSLFSAEYETAIKIIISVKDAKVLAELMKTYFTLYDRYGANKNNIHFYRSDQLFEILLEQSGKVTDDSLFETWDGLFAASSGTPGFKNRYAALSPTSKSNVDKFRHDEREKRRKRRSILDVLRDEHARQSGHAPQSNDELYDLNPRPAFANTGLGDRITFVMTFWNLSKRDYDENYLILLNAAVDTFSDFVKAQGKSDLLALFKTIRQLRLATLGKVEFSRNSRSGAAETYRTSGDSHERAMLFALYTLACVRLLAVAQADKLFTRNRIGFTREEVEYFCKPLADWQYRSNMRHVLTPPFKGPEIAFGQIKAFLNVYVLTKAQLQRADLVPLDKTMEIQEKWRLVSDLTDLIDLASRRGDVGRLNEIFQDPRNEKAILLLQEIGSTGIKTNVTGPMLGRATLGAGSFFGSHAKYGDLAVVYIDPANLNMIYVEFATLKPNIFLVHKDYVEDKVLGERILEIHRNTVGMVHITELIFMAMGFMPVLIEAGFAGLIYEIAVAYVGGKIEEQASKINPTFGKVLGILIQAFAPRPHFGPKVDASMVERADNTSLNEVLTKPTTKPFLDRATGGRNRAAGGALKATPPKPPKLPGPAKHFPFGGGGQPMPKPVRPNKVYRIMSRDEAAQTLAARPQRLPPPIKGAEGERFISLDDDYAMLFREKELFDLEKKFAKQLRSDELAEWNIRKNMAKARVRGDTKVVAKMETRLEKLEADAKQRGIANKAEADAVIKEWHAMEGQQVVVEIELEEGAIEEILGKSVDYKDWGPYRDSEKDVFMWKFERNYGRNIGIPKWQLDAFNRRILKIREYGWKQPLGTGGLKGIHGAN